MEDKDTLKETLVNEDTPQDKETTVRSAGISSSVYNLINGILGSGILVLPMSVSKFGWCMGSLLLLLFAFISAITCYLLSKIYYFTGSTTYAGMGKELFGPWANTVINIIQVLYGLGALFSYTIVAADESHYVMEHILSSVVKPNFWQTLLLDRAQFLCLLSLLVILPPALLPHINNLRYTSFISIGAVALLIIIEVIRIPSTGACTLSDVATYACTKAHQCVIVNDPIYYEYTNLTSCLEHCEHCVSEPTTHHFYPFTFAAGAFFSLPFFCFSSTCQVQFVPILAELKNPNKKNVISVLVWSFASIYIIYVIAGLSGYYSFCGYTTNNILDSFPINDIGILICRIAMVICMCFSIPLFSHPLRAMILDLMNIKEPKYWMVALITTIIITTDAIVAIVAKDLGTVLGITGAIGSSTIMMILPSIMYIQYLRKSKQTNIMPYIMSVTILVLGLVFGTLGTIATIQQS